jgi:cytochrome c peroxidase
MLRVAIRALRPAGPASGQSPALAAKPLRRVWGALFLGLSMMLATAAQAQVSNELKATYRRPTTIPFPPNNPPNEFKVQLGQSLFFDPRVSGAGNVSCATCHSPALGWSDGLALGIGAAKLGRRSPSILDLAWGTPLMWDGRFATLEEQALGPMMAPPEMNQNMPTLLARLGAIPGYKRMFDLAFPDEGMSQKTIAEAIATYERTIVSATAPFDRWVEGDESAIGDGAKRGFALFNGKAHCSACHAGWRFTDDSFHDIGLKSDDLGRGKIKPDLPLMQHAFKTPGLRNIAQRGPYMHDGSITTLAAVVREYNDGFIVRPSLSPEIKRLNLTDTEINEVVAFMLTLTSRDKPVTIPTLPTTEAQ